MGAEAGRRAVAGSPGGACQVQPASVQCSPSCLRGSAESDGSEQNHKPLPQLVAVSVASLSRVSGFKRVTLQLNKHKEI